MCRAEGEEMGEAFCKERCDRVCEQPCEAGVCKAARAAVRREPCKNALRKNAPLAEPREALCEGARGGTQAAVSKGRSPGPLPLNAALLETRWR